MHLERLDVAQDRLGVLAQGRALVARMPGHHQVVERKHPAKAQKPQPHPRHDLGLRAGALERAFKLRGPALAGRAEHVGRHLLQRVARALGHVGEIGHDVVHQPQEHPVRAIWIGRRQSGARRVGVERARRVVAHGDQAVGRQDEGDRHRRRLAVGQLPWQHRGHVRDVALPVDPVRHLDLFHVREGRHLDVQRLDERHLGIERAVQVDPDRAVQRLVHGKRAEARAEGLVRVKHPGP